jgi:hypothetical protein
MQVKLIVFSFIAALLSLSCQSLPPAVTSQSASDIQPSPVESPEIINGMPVRRLEEIDGLVSASDLIVIGQIQQSLEEAEPRIIREADGAISSFSSYVNMKVKKVFKGDANLKNQTLKIGQNVVILTDNAGNPYIQAVEGASPFQKGRYLLFLRKAAAGFEGYFPVGLYYGRHNLDGTDGSEANINDTSYQTIRRLVRERFRDTP